ncbi:polysaccharide pyruvyl transferase family protein [Acuticoccus kandeliae]|uniref:polysaccharide pyruvyl transferase family protein n=1 Tax=Acuticoccus kandeliae TaxID=2073160 RepID=UPI000D3EE12D|nr:polysaccharide pyruvyl transferase family protein [Acuticoccus kandeliae]
MAKIDPVRIAARLSAPVVAMRRPSERAALVIAPTDVGSLGDAAMLIAAYQTLKDQGFDRVSCVSSAEWADSGVFDAYYWADDHFFDGNMRSLARLLWKVRDYEAVFFVGADVLDGTYNAGSVARRLQVLDWFAAQGKTATVLGSSFTETPNALCCETLRAFPANATINARDPVSKARMERFLERPITLVADVAFLAQPDPTVPQARDFETWIAARRAAGDRIVAINANYHNDAKVPGYTAKHVDIARALLDANTSLIFVPHDTRTKRSDVVVVEEIMAALPAGSADRVRYCEPTDPRAVKAILAMCDFIVTGRMHVAILGMGAGVPAYSFGYQGKFEGLYKLLGLPAEKLLENPADIVSRFDEILANILAGLDEAKTHAATLEAALPGVRAMSLANFAMPGKPPRAAAARGGSRVAAGA